VLPDGRNSSQISQKGPEKKCCRPREIVAEFWQIFVKSGSKGAGKMCGPNLLYFEKKEGLILFHLMDLFRINLFQQEC